jgi:hypothetical protein
MVFHCKEEKEFELWRGDIGGGYSLEMYESSISRSRIYQLE